MPRSARSAHETTTGQAATTERSVALCLVCLTPPPEDDAAEMEFGLLDRAGALHVGERQPDGTIRYDFTLAVVDYGADDRPRWRGPWLHGTAAAPFCYLGLRQNGAGGPSWHRRLKIPLGSIDRAQVVAALAEGRGLVATITGRGSGTVPLLGTGWALAGGRP